MLFKTFYNISWIYDNLNIYKIFDNKMLILDEKLQILN